MLKFVLLIKSIVLKLWLMVVYHGRVRIRWINSIRGKCDISAADDAEITIGNFLMANGPLYVRASKGSSIVIGDNVFFNHNCSITALSKVTIGDGTIFGNNIVIVDHDHCIGCNGVEDGYNKKPVQIGKNVWIGANAVILKGSIIDDGAVIAAGAVVKGHIAANELWGGVPAKCLKKIS